VRECSATLDALPGVATSFTLYFVEGKDELTPESQAQLETSSPS
jgi:hypothetical protein